MKKYVVHVMLSLAVGAFFIWLALDRMIADIGEEVGGGNVWREIVQAFSELEAHHIAIYLVLFGVVHLVRVVRWYIQLRPLGADDAGTVVRVGLVGLGAIIVMPLRLGEFVRPWLLARETDVTFSAAMGTAVVERVVDGLCVCLMLYLTINFSATEAVPFVNNAAWVCFVVFAGALVAIALFTWQRELAAGLVRGTIGRFAAGLAEGIVGLMEGFVEGVVSLRRGGALLPYALLTVVYWGLNGVSVWYWATAFGFELPLVAGYAMVSVLVVGIMVPAGPGFFGNFQLFLGEGLRLFVPAAQIGAVGFAMALGMNLLQFVLQVGLAVPAMIALGLSVKSVVKAAESPGEGEATPGSAGEAM